MKKSNAKNREIVENGRGCVVGRSQRGLGIGKKLEARDCPRRNNLWIGDEGGEGREGSLPHS